MNSVLRIAAGAATGRLGGLTSRLFPAPADAIALPTYPAAVTEARRASSARTSGMR